ncbi:hypothetical protein SAY86_031500 [Trapa natans]|uniref:Uncharacterized protein n=1 Tax=Trapa natans TaxID=22666 RepID=A0AAN7R5X9_TRANT|nr:hypothetical protein SAY86_031500 [Trapa natans]
MRLSSFFKHSFIVPTSLVQDSRFLGSSFSTFLPFILFSWKGSHTHPSLCLPLLSTLSGPLPEKHKLEFGCLDKQLLHFQLSVLNFASFHHFCELCCKIVIQHLHLVPFERRISPLFGTVVAKFLH